MKNLISIIALFLLNSAQGQDNFADCSGSIILCEKADLVIKKLIGTGKKS